MATENEIDDDNTGENDSPQGMRNRIKSLEKENRRIADLEKELGEFKQKDAIREAGIELNDRQTKALLATHDGDLTPELLRKTAVELGFAEEEPDTDPDVQEKHQQVQDASRGAQTGNNQSYADEINAANSKEEVAAIAAKHGMPISASV